MLGLIIAAGMAAATPATGLWFGSVPLDAATVQDATLGEQAGPNDLMTFRLTGEGQAKLSAFMKAHLHGEVPVVLNGRTVTMVTIHEVPAEPYASVTVPDADAAAMLALLKDAN